MKIKSNKENMLTYISKNLHMNDIFESMHLSLRYENLNSYKFQNPSGITALNGGRRVYSSSDAM